MFGTSIIPLAITVMLGPQILVAMLLITHKKPLQSSIIYIIAVVTTIILTTFIAYNLITVMGLHRQSGNDEHNYLKYIIISLLLILLIWTFVNRKKITSKPKWMENISAASPKKIFSIGVFLIALMPTDLAIAFTIGGLILTNRGILLDATPFFLAVTLIASLPLMFYLALGKKGHQYIDTANDWLNTHGWVINTVVYTFFIYLLIS